MVTVQSLTEVGYSAAEAAEIAALPPVEQVRRLEIVGNAWSDGPLFNAIRSVLTDKALPVAEKKFALEQSYRVVGVDVPDLSTDELVAASIAEYLKEDEGPME